jgi:GR25 family glycosyltransferase involved in LPS biosynthesis
MSDQPMAGDTQTLDLDPVRPAGEPDNRHPDDSALRDNTSREGRQPQSSRDAEAAPLAEELAVALGEHAALIIHSMERWFDHTLSHIDRISERVETHTFSSPAPMVDGNTTARKSRKATGPLSPAAGDPPQSEPPQSEPPLVGTPIARFRRYDDWVDWRYHQAVKMHPGGTVEIRQDRSTPGVVTKGIAVESGGLYRFVIEVELIHEADGCRLHARPVCDGGVQLGPDVPLSAGRSEIFVFAPARIRELMLYLIVWEPKVGYTFRLRSVAIEKIDLDNFFEARVRGRSRKAIASLATIPSRREMLSDCVASLLLQCDKVRVFLNNYPDVPSDLLHPRVEIRRSQDWDDKGDAGKFGWLDCEAEPGYRIIADDDLIFPVDFADKMTAVVARHGNRAIAGVHGILLKQPIKEYYDPESRSAFFFEAPLMRERTVHVLGTNALCYHSATLGMRWSDFMFPNMADIFLARYAQKRSLPMVAVERPHHWVQQNTQKGKYDTIFEHCSKQTRSRFDSSIVQDAIIKWMAPLTLQPCIRPKVVLAVIAWSADHFQRIFESWHRTRWLDFDWVVLVTAGTEDDRLRRALREWRTDHEMHVIDGTETTPYERIDQLLTLMRRIGFQAAMLIDGNVEFVGGGWTKPILGVLENASPRALLVGAGAGPRAASWCGPGPEIALPALVMVNPALADLVGGVDEECGDPARSVSDWMRRADSASCLATLDDSVANAVKGSLRVIPGLLEARVAETQPAAAAGRKSRRPFARVALSVNEVFETVLTINLDRRPDRWVAVRRRLGNQGIETARFQAVDGTASNILAEYEEYRRRPLAAPPEAVRPIQTSWEYYQDYDCQTARIAHIEQTTHAKAIQSAGAWGYLKTWEAILEQALRDRPETLLVFDDDIILHRRTHEIFPAAVGGLPADWLILQLGTLQYHWEGDWITWRNRFLYSTNGSAIGSHAVGLRFEIIPYLLDQVRRMELPFDTGALSAATHAFKERCFVAYPNIAIQSLADSDIGTSDFQEARAQTDVAKTYRWNLPDYDTLPDFRFVGGTGNLMAPVTRIVLNR